MFIKILIFFVILGGCFGVKGQNIFEVPYETQADFIVYVTPYETRADLIVYRVKLPNFHNKGIWHFTQIETQSEFKIFITDIEVRADLIIYFTHVESRAGWVKTHKRSLLY
jgi:hypothetical protein